MKFLCDQMLMRLGRWLRAAGYDTEIAEPDASDRDILEKAKKEKRYLITRDKHFLEMGKEDPLIIWLRSNDVSSCIRELSEKLKINWQFDPFSRCLQCNEKLVNGLPEMAVGVPKDVLERGLPLMFCQHCQKAFWPGSHTTRMLNQLKAFMDKA
jgi:uncharacterized protein with PIN domain